MKTLLFLFFCLTLPAFASAQSDSSAYQVQRTKVNALLADRSSKFGQYDQSLVQRTGIFGLKSKRDMQRSIDILTEIVKTDNAVFRELKVLLDYKDLEKAQVADQFTDTESRVMGYKTAITRLQQQTEQLQSDLEKAQKKATFISTAAILSLLIFFGLAAWMYRTKKLTFN